MTRKVGEVKVSAAVALFKVLVDGKPCHGGDGAFEYPAAGKPTPEVDAPRCCDSGYHLTSDPLRWWKPKAQLWLATVPDECEMNGDGSDKAAFSQVILLERVTREWAYAPMFPRVRAFLAASERSADKDADVAWATLSWANLSGANLSRANLSGATLSWANLSGANLSGAYRPQSAPAGWETGADGRLNRAVEQPQAVQP